jgi:hypothetical protein
MGEGEDAWASKASPITLLNIEGTRPWIFSGTSKHL